MFQLLDLSTPVFGLNTLALDENLPVGENRSPSLHRAQVEMLTSPRTRQKACVFSTPIARQGNLSDPSSNHQATAWDVAYWPAESYINDSNANPTAVRRTFWRPSRGCPPVSEKRLRRSWNASEQASSLSAEEEARLASSKAPSGPIRRYCLVRTSGKSFGITSMESSPTLYPICVALGGNT
jgi:hypothetical protein